MQDTNARRNVLAFLALLVLVRGPFYIAALIGGWGNATRNVPIVMVVFAVLSAPPLLAVAMRLATQRNLCGFGWKLGHPIYLVAGWAAPIVIALLVYGVAWMCGLVAPIAGRPISGWGLIGPGIGATLGLAIPTLVFEELGWRGYLVPELAKFLSFGKVALISGVVWALFHYPFILSPVYATTPPTIVNVMAFTLAIMAASVPLAWLRLRSGSVWPCVLFHAAHNAFVNEVLAKSFTPTGKLGAAIVGESGIGLAIGYTLLASWCWRHKALASASYEPVTGWR